MDISTSTDLIPYSHRQYPIQRYEPGKTIVVNQFGRNSNTRHSRWQPPLGAEAIHLRYGGNRYDALRCLHHADDYQVGQLVNLYA